MYLRDDSLDSTKLVSTHTAIWLGRTRQNAHQHESIRHPSTAPEPTSLELYRTVRYLSRAVFRRRQSCIPRRVSWSLLSSLSMAAPTIIHLSNTTIGRVSLTMLSHSLGIQIRALLTSNKPKASADSPNSPIKLCPTSSFRCHITNALSSLHLPNT